MIGFDRPGWLRLIAAGAFCVAAVALCLAVEGRPAPRTTTTVADPAAPVARRLTVASTYPVATWRVAVLGVVQAAERSDDRSWHGTVRLPPGEEVLIVGAAGAGSPTGGRALRAVLAGAPERVAWGEGDVALTVAP